MCDILEEESFPQMNRRLFPICSVFFKTLSEASAQSTDEHGVTSGEAGGTPI